MTLPEQARPFLLEGGARGVLLIHGFTATPALVRPLGEALHADAAGGEPRTARGILLPGHGSRIQDMRSQGGAGPWLNAALAAYDDLAARCRQVSVVGHSMGGVLALLVAQRRPALAAIAIAAPMRLVNRLARVAPLIGWAAPFIDGKTVRRGEGFLTEYDIGYPGTPLCRVGDLIRLMRRAERGLPSLRCPLLVVQSRDDRTTRPVSAEIILRKAGSAVKEALWLERSGHLCTIGPERERLFAACAAFLARAERADG